jgi:hypothetical protein
MSVGLRSVTARAYQLPTLQSSQASDWFHKPVVSGAAPGTATIFASMQQPADFFCKEIMTEHHRLEDPLPLFA